MHGRQNVKKIDISISKADMELPIQFASRPVYVVSLIHSLEKSEIAQDSF